MKTIIQLLIAGLVIHGCVRFGSASWRNYQFKDAVEQEVRFTPQATPEQLQARVAQLAADYAVLLEPGDVAVERRGQETFVRASYSELIPLVPGFYTREQPFALDVRVRVLAFERIR